MSSYSTTVASASLQQPQSQIYSQVSKRGNETSSAAGTSKNTEFEATTKYNTTPTMEGSGSSSSNLRGCDTDSAALERLSQLLTSSKDSEVSVKNDLINLDDQQHTYAPMAAAEDSLGKKFNYLIIWSEICKNINPIYRFNCSK